MKQFQKVDLVCHYCGRHFKRHPSLVMDGRRVFCRVACFDADRPVQHRREDVLQCLVKHALAHGGQGLTYREIGERVGISSPSVVKHVLNDLAADKLIILPDKVKSRAIEVVGMKVVWEDPREAEGQGAEG